MLYDAQVQSICDNSITYGTIIMDCWHEWNEIKISPPTIIVSDCIIIGSTLFIRHGCGVDWIRFYFDIYIAIENSFADWQMMSASNNKDSHFEKWEDQKKEALTEECIAQVEYTIKEKKKKH